MDDLTKLSGPDLADRLAEIEHTQWQADALNEACRRLREDTRAWQRKLEQERDGLRARVAELEAKEASACGRMSPSVDPITGDEFFMAIEHPSRGWVATYGGPLDSYTLCERADDDDGYTRERYCHDRGAWIELETVDVRVVDNSDFLKAEELDERIAELEGELADIDIALDTVCPERTSETRADVILETSQASAEALEEWHAWAREKLGFADGDVAEDHDLRVKLDAREDELEERLELAEGSLRSAINNAQSRLQQCKRLEAQRRDLGQATSQPLRCPPTTPPVVAYASAAQAPDSAERKPHEGRVYGANKEPLGELLMRYDTATSRDVQTHLRELLDERKAIEAIVVVESCHVACRVREVLNGKR
jgi:hypothetical protein